MKYQEIHKGSKKGTIVLLPDVTGNIKQFSVSNFLGILLLCLMVSSAIFLTWVILDYQSIKGRKLMLVQAQKENKAHYKEFLLMTEQMHNLWQDADQLREYFEEIKETLDLVAGDRHTERAGIGGSDSGLFQPDFPTTRPWTEQELVRYMHRSLDNLREEVDSTRLTAIEIAQFMRHGSWENIQESSPLLTELDIHDKKDIRRHLKTVAIDLGLQPNLALGMAKVESGYNPKSVSPKGAVGVLQLMPHVAWHEFKVTRQFLFNPYINIRLGLLRMKYLLKRFDDDLDLALAAYNAGASRVVNAGFSIPPIKETQAYVRKVKAAMENED